MSDNKSTVCWNSMETWHNGINTRMQFCKPQQQVCSAVNKRQIAVIIIIINRFVQRDKVVTSEAQWNIVSSVSPNCQQRRKTSRVALMNWQIPPFSQFHRPPGCPGVLRLGTHTDINKIIQQQQASSEFWVCTSAELVNIRGRGVNKRKCTAAELATNHYYMFYRFNIL